MGAIMVCACTEKRNADSVASVDAHAAEDAEAEAKLASLASADAQAHAIADAGPRLIAATSAPTSDAGSPACRQLGAASIQGFNGPVAMHLITRLDADIAELVFNEGGRPRTVVPVLAPIDAGVPSSDAPPPKSPLPACAIAGEAIYCADATGAIRRGERVVARSRAGTDIAATTMGTHVLLAYLAERVTTEGLVREAFITMDDGTPVRLSEDGSGATFVELAPRGEGAVAMTIDARVAMTPTHARMLHAHDGKLEIGEDAVIFVGGSAERHNSGALATSKDGAALALVAVADDASSFGMAAIAIGDPPKDDVPVVWSLYPNGLDPAPIAATRAQRVMRVARVRPKLTDPKSPRVLELGLLEPKGAFRPTCIAAEASFIKDVEIAVDRDDAVWLFYRDPRGSRLERRAPPSEK
jgi:hypothetical protein